jgi:hypothetical protein
MVIHNPHDALYHEFFIHPKFLTWFFEVQDVKLTPAMTEKLKSKLEVNEMLRTKILAERKTFFQDGIEQGILQDKQGVLIDLMSIKFGSSEKTVKKVKSILNAAKLDKALQKILSTENKDDVLKCLD